MTTRRPRSEGHARPGAPRAEAAGIRLKRAYEPAEPSDGYRVLVDRLWPRGRSKEQVQIDAWAKDLGPSDELRRWFAHDPSRWDEFAARYRHELQSPAARQALEGLAERVRQGPLTIVYAARDEQHNNAVVLRAELGAMLERSAARRQRPNRAA